MGIKHTYEFIKNEIEKEDYILLEKEYINALEKMNMICNKGHNIFMKWNSFQQGHRCLKCSGSEKKTIEFVRDSFSKRGFELLSKRYKGNKQKMEYICDKGHRNKTTWKELIIGRRCPDCSKKKKKTIEFVRSEFSKENYTLLSKSYENIYQKLKFICTNGHEYEISFDKWQQGRRCKLCSQRHSTKEKLMKFKYYRRSVDYFTKMNYRKFKDVVNPLNLKRSVFDFQVDHKFSVLHGFKNNVDIKVIANPYNLQMLTAEDNKRKSFSSSITKDELFIGYKLYEEETF